MAVEIGVDCWYDVHPDGETDNAGRLRVAATIGHMRRAHEEAWEEANYAAVRALTTVFRAV
jgi:hypothetical protein